MTAKKPSPKKMPPLCGELGPEDGMDPREFARKGRPRKEDRKVRQLCSQVAETLSLVLSGECGDELIQSLQVVAVDPAPDATQLLVAIRAGLPGELVDRDKVSERLAKILGRLRCEVAASITRKRAPKLLFRVL
jgi:ribosome-binding factor A